MKLTDVSNTSIATSLRSHVIESEKKNPILNDLMAKYVWINCTYWQQGNLLGIYGFNVSHEWLNEKLESKKHIAIGKNNTTQ